MKFSWYTSDTRKSISAVKPIYLLIPKKFGGGYIEEKDYKCDGILGGKNVFGLIAEWNVPNEKLLEIKDKEKLGYEIYLDESDYFCDYAVKVVENSNLVYEDVEESWVEAIKNN